jgi:hypothetical protein
MKRSGEVCMFLQMRFIDVAYLVSRYVELLRVQVYYQDKFTVITFRNAVFLHLIKYSLSRHSFQIKIVVIILYIYI